MSLKAAALRALERNRTRNLGATDPTTTCNSGAISESADLESRIRTMAKRWDYAPDELAEALALAAADPVGWERLCTHDQAASKPESEEQDTQPLQTVRCADCQHYQRTNHPHLGHCTLGENEASVGLWDGDRRLCESYRADEQADSA